MTTLHYDTCITSPFHSQTPHRDSGFADHEASLWRAVITQALMDAASRSRKPEAIRQRHEALEWLLGITRDFEIVCDNAGLDPDYVRTEARAALRRGFVWRLPAGQGWRTAKARQEQQPEPHHTITKH